MDLFAAGTAQLKDLFAAGPAQLKALFTTGPIQPRALIADTVSSTAMAARWFYILHK